MNKLFTVTLLFVIVLYGCNSTKNKAETVRVYYSFNKNSQSVGLATISAATDTSVHRLNIVSTKIRKNEKNQYLIFSGFDIQTNDYVLGNLKTGNVNHYNFQLKNNPNDFDFVNEDSVFILFSASYTNSMFHDSLISLRNIHGEILKNYSLNGAKVLTHSQPEYYENENALMLNVNQNNELVYHDNKLFVQFTDSYSNLSIENNRLPHAGYIDCKTGTFKEINVIYPDITQNNQFYSSVEKDIVTGVSHDGDVLYSFGYTPTILKYNYHTDKITKIRIKSSVIDTVYPASSETEIPGGLQYSMPYPRYLNIVYDKNRQLYYRFMLLPQEFGKYKFLMQIADTSFNLIAEAYPVPTNSVFVTKEHVYFGAKPYKISYTKSQNQNLIQQITATKVHVETNITDLSKYFKTYIGLKSKNLTAVLMWMPTTCEGTQDYIFQHFQANMEMYSKSDTYLILVTGKKTNIQERLSSFNLTGKENVFIDSIFEYGRYNNFNQHSLPRIIKIRKNKVAADTTFNLGSDKDIIDIQNYILDLSKEQLRLKK